MMGLGFPETRHSSSTVSPSRTTNGDLPRGTVRLGGTKKEKNVAGSDVGLLKANRPDGSEWFTAADCAAVYSVFFIQDW